MALASKVGSANSAHDYLRRGRPLTPDPEAWRPSRPRPYLFGEDQARYLARHRPRTFSMRASARPSLAAEAQGATTGQCQKSNVQFGCYAKIVGGKATAAICVD
jgi:hypothetical protein